jgi:hypothetical protein
VVVVVGAAAAAAGAAVVVVVVESAEAAAPVSMEESRAIGRMNLFIFVLVISRKLQQDPSKMMLRVVVCYRCHCCVVYDVSAANSKKCDESTLALARHKEANNNIIIKLILFQAKTASIRKAIQPKKKNKIPMVFSMTSNHVLSC